MIWIGIDPGVKTGFCVYERKKGILKILTTDFVALITEVFPKLESELIAETQDVSLQDFVGFVIEDPSKNKPMFIERYDPKSVKIALRQAQNIGMNKREGTLLIEYFRCKGYKVISYRPNATKWSMEEFRKVTKYTGKVSQHSIDAARMVWGR